MAKIVKALFNKLSGNHLFISSIYFIRNEPFSAAVVAGACLGVFAAGFVVGWTADFIVCLITKR